MRTAEPQLSEAGLNGADEITLSAGFGVDIPRYCEIYRGYLLDELISEVIELSDVMADRNSLTNRAREPSSASVRRM
jgi:hypothetical protein